MPETTVSICWYELTLNSERDLGQSIDTEHDSDFIFGFGFETDLEGFGHCWWN